MTRVALFTLFAASLAFGRDDERFAKFVQAQTQFEAIEAASDVSLSDAAACVQSQVALLSIANTEEAPLIRFRKGYCTLIRAALTQTPSMFMEAATDFQKAIEGWPARFVKKTKTPAEPVSSAWRALEAISRLMAGPPDDALESLQNALNTAAQTAACPSSAMSPAVCKAVLVVANRWAGYLAMQRDNWIGAERAFSTDRSTGWANWVAGQKAFRDAHYDIAAKELGEAVRIWQAARQARPTLMDRLSPTPDFPGALTAWGGALAVSGHGTEAIQALTEAVRLAPQRARALYLRGRAKELVGHKEEALADFNLASRTAFAAAEDSASGEAHLYRGILFFRRKDFAHAEDSFSSALNFDIPEALRPDAVAWKNLAAVSSGACEASRPLLEQSLASVSPFFPKDEARAAIASCRPTITSGLALPGQLPD